MSAADHIEQIHEQGWTRINTAPGEWVALVLNTENSAFGGTLWKQGEDGNDTQRAALRDSLSAPLWTLTQPVEQSPC